VVKSGFEVGDLVKLRWSANKQQSKYHLGIILRAPSPYSKSKLFKILWLTKSGESAIVVTESFNLELLSAHEGNENRFKKYRKTDE